MAASDSFQLRMKTHRKVWAEVSLSAIEQNIRSISSHLKSKGQTGRVLPVVKANGYGHGSVPIVKHLLRCFDYSPASEVIGFAVATPEEWRSILDIDASFIPQPNRPFVLMFGATLVGCEEVVIPYMNKKEGMMTPVVTLTSLHAAKSLSRVIQKAKENHEIPIESRLNFHLKLDTGMHRVGLLNDSEIVSFRDEYLDHLSANLRLCGIYTHFSKADEIDKTYTKFQLSKFDQNVTLIKEKIRESEDLLIHAGNSAASMDIESILSNSDLELQNSFHFFRLGISLYGLAPSQDCNLSQEVKITPAMKWVAHFVHIKKVPSNSLISYGGTYQTTANQWIGTLPFGYADGYRRRLGNVGGGVLFRGEFVPLVGRVCMDAIMVDITSVLSEEEKMIEIEEKKDAICHEEVIIIGSQGKNSLSADDMANKLETINYEITCLVGPRVPRIYTCDEQIIDVQLFAC